MIVIFLTTILATAGLVVDVGLGYWNRQRMQAAADAASLSAVNDIYNQTICLQTARTWASYNGFTHGVGGCSVTIVPNPGGNPSRIQVNIARPMNTLLTRLVGVASFNIAVTSTAELQSLLPINITGGTTPGATTQQTLSLYGPYGDRANGDPHSPRFQSGGGTNPDHIPGGYNFSVDFPATYTAQAGTSNARIAVFDPDTNQGGANSTSNTDFDENRPPPSGVSIPAGQSNRGRTVFTVYRPDSTPNDYSDDTVLATFTSDGTNTAINGQTPNRKWVPLADVDIAAPPVGTGPGPYRINVVMTEGAAENGFNLVATRASYISNSGTTGAVNFPAGSVPTQRSAKINALGYLPLNFTVSGEIAIELGNIPAAVNGLTTRVRKFDTEVNALYVRYTDSTGTFNDLPGVLAPNNEFREDVLTVPLSYPGGLLTAEYRAGVNDTSLWSMFFDGTIPGQPGRVRLVD